MKSKKAQYLSYLYITLAVVGSVAFIVAPHALSALLVLGGSYGVYKDIRDKRPSLNALEADIRDSLRLTANENIHRAMVDHNPQPVSFLDRLKERFGEQWVLDLEEHQIQWMRNEYDALISSYWEKKKELSRKSVEFEEFGRSEQKHLASYFRGKDEQRKYEDFS